MKITPTMADFRLLVLAVIRDYHQEWGTSPSYGEIAARLDCGRTRARKAVKSLAASGLVLRTPGPRGIALPSLRDQAVRQLKSLGWEIDEDFEVAAAPRTNRTLPVKPLLSYRPDSEGDGHPGASNGDSAGDRQQQEYEATLAGRETRTRREG